MTAPVKDDSGPRKTYTRQVLLFKVIANEGRLRIIRATTIFIGIFMPMGYTVCVEKDGAIW